MSDTMAGKTMCIVDTDWTLHLCDAGSPLFPTGTPCITAARFDALVDHRENRQAESDAIKQAEIEAELEGWRTETRAGQQADAAGLFLSFRTAFLAGIAFACRSQPHVRCFCGHHVSQQDSSRDAQT